MVCSLIRWPLRPPVPCLFPGCGSTVLLLSANTEIHSLGGTPAGCEITLAFSAEGRQTSGDLEAAIAGTLRPLGVRVEPGRRNKDLSEFRIVLPLRSSGWTKERAMRQVSRILLLCREPRSARIPVQAKEAFR